MLKLRYKMDSPLRPPRIVIGGPPGSGRTAQTEALSQTFGLVNVCVKDLLKAEVHNNPENGKIIAQCIDSGDQIPDSIVNPLVENRLKQSDCRVNGWILDGFPETDGQINLLKAMRIKPSLVFLFEQIEDESVRRLSNRRVDPNTGAMYNLEVNPPGDEATSNRLIEAKEDSLNTVKKMYAMWSDKCAKLEDAYKNCHQMMQSDKPQDQLTEALADAIQNPM